MNTHEEWYVGIVQKMDADKGDMRWKNAKSWYPGNKLGDRYCKSEAEARKVLDYAYTLFNGTHCYNAKGERYETDEVARGVRVGTVFTKEDDIALSIVRHRIQKRVVTDWEIVEMEK